MAKLPDLTAQGSAAPQVPGGIAPGAGPTGLEAAPARLLQQTGQGFQEAGAFLARAQEEQDRLRAEDAFNELRAKQVDLEAGEKGFGTLKGDQVVKAPVFQDYTKQFDSATSDIEKGLANENQRQLFRRRAAVSAMQFKGDLLKHISNETDKYRGDVYRATLATEVQNGSAHWDDVNAVGLSAQRIRAAVDAEGDHRGWDKDTRDAEAQRHLGQLHKDVIVQALANEQYNYAKAYFDANRKDIDPTTSAVLAKGVDGAEQKQLSSSLRTEFLAQRDSPAGLRALEKKVNGSGLDEDRKNVLLSAILSRQDVLENKERIEAEKRLRVQQKGLGEATTMILEGFEPNTDQLATLVDATKGTELEGEAKNVVALAKATSGFRALTPAQQQAQITDLEAKVRQAPTPQNVKILTAWKTIAGKQTAQLNADPIAYGGRQGLVEVQPLPLDNPSQMGDALAERYAQGRALRARLGAPFKPLQDAEVKALQDGLKEAPAAKKAEFFGQLAQASRGDMAGYSAIMGQLAPGDPVTAVAGEFMGKQRPVASEILAGQEILRPKKDGKPDQGKLWPMPPDTDMRKEFQGIERDAFAARPEQRNAIYQAALAVYAKRTADAGDASGVINSSRFDQAIQDVAGQIVKWNGKGTALPYGMDQSGFKNALRAHSQQLVDQGAVSPLIGVDGLMDLPLEQIGDGRYVFRSGQSALVSMSGQPVIVDFNNPIPWRSSGSR